LHGVALPQVRNFALLLVEINNRFLKKIIKSAFLLSASNCFGDPRQYYLFYFLKTNLHCISELGLSEKIKPFVLSHVEV